MPSEPTSSEQSFPERLFHLGISSLVSVIPPGAELSATSNISQKLLGKIPGTKGPYGWRGFNWRKHETTIDDVRQWLADGANFGLRSDAFPAVDIDSLNDEIVELVTNAARSSLGPAPIRIGKAPKRLLMYKTSEPFGRLRLWFDSSSSESPRPTEHLVEILGRGNQYLVHGTHPSGRAYTWLQDPTEQLLTEITSAQASQFLDELGAHLQSLGFRTFREGSPDGGSAASRAACVNQSSLQAPSIEALREAVLLIPNDEDFASRTDYLRMGYAIKAAAGTENEQDGLEIFAEWAARWTAGVNDTEVVEGDWRRMNGPKVVGWDYIARQARAHGFNDVQYHFDVTEPAPQPPEPKPTQYSDQWLAREIAKAHADRILYVTQREKFLVWDGARWKEDNMLAVERTITQELARVAEPIARQGGTKEHRQAAWKFAKSLCSAAKARAVGTLLRSEQGITTSVEELDDDAWTLNTPGGSIDLRTGVLRPADPRDRCTRSTVVSPDSTMECSTWLRFLDETTAGDVELQAYLQRLAGYALTGSTEEQQVTFVWGPGGNGKSVFLNTLASVLGDYARVASMDTFTASNFDRHPTDMAMLAGARLVYASETANGKAWDDTRLKSLTGGDPISARYMRQDFFTYTPTFKLIIVGNHKPALRTAEEAIKRRLQLVPFTHKPAKIDLKLAEKLKAELPAILQWMIEGCLAWQQMGLRPPKAVLAATDEYFADQDVLGRWIREACDIDGSKATDLQELYESYRSWIGATGESAGTDRAFSQLLTNYGLARRRHPETRRLQFVGLAVRHRAELAEDVFQPGNP